MVTNIQIRGPIPGETPTKGGFANSGLYSRVQITKAETPSGQSRQALSYRVQITLVDTKGEPPPQASIAASAKRVQIAIAEPPKGEPTTDIECVMLGAGCWVRDVGCVIWRVILSV